MDREQPGGHPRGLGWVGRPFRWVGMCREALLEGREGLGGSPGCTGEVCRLSLRSGRGRETRPKIQKAHPEVRVG